MKQKNIEKIREATEKALEYEQIIKEKIKNSPLIPVVGNVYCLLVGTYSGINWAVIRCHIDDPNLWFVVPHDMCSQVGTWDVKRSEQDYVLRCGCGTWVSSEQLPHNALMDFLSEKDIVEARKRLAAMVGHDIIVEYHSEVDNDLDYSEWNEVVLSAAHQLSEETEVSSLVRFVDK